MISSAEAEILIHKLVTEQLPVFACFTSADDLVRITLAGSVEKLTEEGLLILASDNPERPSMMQLPVDKTCEFAYMDKREIPELKREHLAAIFGEAALKISFPSGSSVVMFFNP
jgi:hypothetical protein